MTLPMTGKNCSLALKWLISFAIPLIVYWAMPIDGQTVTHHMALFLSITTWAICIWAMDAMNEIAVGLILPVLYSVLCGVKQQVVYSPWLSEVPLIVIGGFALGKILQETGLGKRIGLTCVRCMGGSFTGTGQLAEEEGQGRTATAGRGAEKGDGMHEAPTLFEGLKAQKKTGHAPRPT